ncbi:hypothetical protein [Companilactobacillus musae]|uniref:hypothetical protein n=1 Tax=Companilactobacillus musae TaxID=1903258 RepID=UPI000E65C325|nr:hypothetical protein [Companilactobacillus musae]
MKNKLDFGTRVEIKAHLNKKTVEWPTSNFQSLDEYIKTLEPGDYLEIEKYKRVEAIETGILMGVRKLKTFMTLELGADDFHPDDIVQTYDEYKSIYLVAINKRCIRKVYPEDIEGA